MDGLRTNIRQVSPRDVVLGLAMFGTVVFGLLVPIPFVSSVAGAVADLFHTPLFGGVTLVVFRALDRWMPLPAFGRADRIRCALVVSGLFGFGVMMEVVQGWAGRSATVHDAVANGLGTLAGLAWFIGRRFRVQGSTVRTAGAWWQSVLPWKFLSLVLLAIAWWNPALVIADFVSGRFRFPLLSSFETETELNRWHFDDCSATLTTVGVTEGARAMKLTFRPVPHPAATLLQVYPDWTGMRALEVDLVLDEGYPGEAVDFVLKVIDQDHVNYDSDTFRYPVRLSPGQPVHVRVGLDQVKQGPESRELDLSRIRFVSVLVLDPTVPATVRIDALRLIR